MGSWGSQGTFPQMDSFFSSHWAAFCQDTRTNSHGTAKAILRCPWGPWELWPWSTSGLYSTLLLPCWAVADAGSFQASYLNNFSLSNAFLCLAICKFLLILPESCLPLGTHTRFTAWVHGLLFVCGSFSSATLFHGRGHISFIYPKSLA